MRYIPHTEQDIKAMLARIGVARVEDLFAAVPEPFRLKKPLNLPQGLSEPEVVQTLRRLQKHNPDPEEYLQFLGGGAYRHYTPALVNHIILRGEFMTSYTPYQPEVSQGTLQAIFEFQSLIAMLTGMEIANASMYDGASALAEAVLMAHRINPRTRVLVSRAVHPDYRAAIAAYNCGRPIEIVEIPTLADGRTDIESAARQADESVSAIVLQSPNFFGVVEEYAGLKAKIEKQGVQLIVGVAEPVSLGLLKPPGERGADIVAGEGQGFGLPVSFGGPYVGFFAARMAQFRQMPGRLIGKTVDQDGRAAYTLTLSTREQHIRREKATSNICTNQGLCALAVTIYLAVMGKSGVREVAEQNLQKAEYLKNRLGKLPGYKIKFSADTFNEFVLQCPRAAEQVRDKLIQKKILAGIPLGKHYPDLADCLLVCATEVTSADEMDRLATALAAD